MKLYTLSYGVMDKENKFYAKREWFAKFPIAMDRKKILHETRGAVCIADVESVEFEMSKTGVIDLLNKWVNK